MNIILGIIPAGTYVLDICRRLATHNARTVFNAIRIYALHGRHRKLFTIVCLVGMGTPAVNAVWSPLAVVATAAISLILTTVSLLDITSSDLLCSGTGAWPVLRVHG